MNFTETYMILKNIIRKGIVFVKRCNVVIWFLKIRLSLQDITYIYIMNKLRSNLISDIQIPMIFQTITSSVRNTMPTLQFRMEEVENTLTKSLSSSVMIIMETVKAINNFQVLSQW